MATNRTSYHTHIKLLARDGLLPGSARNSIPKTNIYRWKKEAADKYQDLGLPHSSSDYEIIRSFAQSARAKKLYTAYVRLIKTLVSIVHSIPKFHRAVKQQSKKIVEVVCRVKKLTGLKRALRLFDISIATFRNWQLQTNFPCSVSPTGCNRVFPGQLSLPEVNKLRELLADVRFQYWPVSSIALHALRNNIVALSLNTWYKYVHKLGLKRPKPVSRRKKNTIGIRTNRPHQLWHADITQFITADNCKYFIYLVIDNFSRKILAWKIANSVKAMYCQETIKKALGAVNTSSSITLLTDGGPENSLGNFLRELKPPVYHQIALVDVHYSNSLIEAHNKIIKYNYLYRMNISDGQCLQKVFPSIVDDFNNRPHISLGGLTPNEACDNSKLDKQSLQSNIERATLERKIHNKNHRCEDCL